MQKLFTEDGTNLPEVPWNDYPRPQMRRADWLCLNGKWTLTYNEKTHPVRVPFCPESLLSEIANPPMVGQAMLYRRMFEIPQSWTGRRILLHFGAVSRETSVLINGKEVCRHDNGYLPFSADITGVLQAGQNELCVRVINDLSHTYPWGKQSQKRGGMWYTPCSGIWQTVWLEPVPQEYIRSLRIRTESNHAVIELEGPHSGVAKFAGQVFQVRDGLVRIPVRDPIFWSPENPHLYSFSVTAGQDRIESYFALRTISVQEKTGIPRLCLNGKPYFFNGLLDQGYWSDGLYTPAAPNGFEKDILAMKSLGFNTLRKHIKIEPERFYYDCDRLGMVVFQDMVNCGEYRFLRDTALPTIHIRKMRDQHLNPDTKTRAVFLRSMEETVRQLKNHPCICLWTIFNEGWGQFCSDDAYRRLKELDNSRWIDSTSGWFHQRLSDVDSLHIYFGRLHLGKKKLPQILSEFGGYSCKIPEHSFNLEKTYGYRKYTDKETFIRDLRALYEKSLLPLARQGLCAAIYTQVSDVEDETNGLLTFDRKELKLHPEDLKDVAKRLQAAVQGDSSV